MVKHRENINSKSGRQKIKRLTWEELEKESSQGYNPQELLFQVLEEIEKLDSRIKYLEP